MAQKNPRKIAFDILYDAIENDIKYNDLLSKYSYHKYFNFINNLLNTSIKNLILIDFIIDSHTKQSLTEKKFFKYVLRCAICELYFINTPQHAVFFEWINIVKQNKKFSTLSGVINAILHNLLRELPTLNTLKLFSQELSEEKISIKYSIPKWIIERLKKTYTLEEIEKIASFFQTTPDTCLRLNTNLLPENKIKKFLLKDDILFTDSKFFQDVVLVQKFSKPIKNLSTYGDGLFYIQDESSIAFIKSVVPLIKSSSKILDATCGLGGKLSALYQYLDNTQSFTLWEPNKNKIDLCLQNLNRLKIKNISPKNSTLTKLPVELKKRFKNYFDYIFLDPPCSGLGSIRRKPQAKYSRTPRNVNDLILTQRNIFDSSLKLLKPGGLVFFSLCTLNPDETYENVKYFTEKYDNIKTISFPNDISDSIKKSFLKDMQYFSPEITETKTDYLFGAIFQKIV